MGARLKVREIDPRRWDAGNYAVDIQSDRHGQFFELRIPEALRESLELSVMQSESKQRHLLLAVRNTKAKRQLDRFLCGHDEREWFVAAVPGHASSVRQAMDALQPEAVQNALTHHQVSFKERYRRKNPAFRRQGEWFFLPEPSLAVDPRLILHHEPIRRGLGKPHIVEELFRDGGKRVYVSRQRPNGVTEHEYQALLRDDTNDAALWRWQSMTRDPTVYARGKVRHPDHATITLPVWHRVLMNTETQSRTMANLAFLD